MPNEIPCKLAKFPCKKCRLQWVLWGIFRENPAGYGKFGAMAQAADT
jgi:hypothetical protein